LIENNNTWPKAPELTKFEIFKARQQQQRATPNAKPHAARSQEKDKKPF
jgi:hypothetical protein